jgi:response regulator RpfG family c-di-GMP phosphodiesterase
MEFLKKTPAPHRRATSAHLQRELRSWKVAIIDDEQQVHAVTRLVLANTRIDDAPLEFLTAHSAAEGLRLFQDNPDIALAFIDVIMETDSAGLDLIHQIRNELQNHSTRIVLRTGQPGSAPEETVIRTYDINDYKSKTELTDTKLKTCAFSCIRSYRDIVTIENSQRGMRKVIDASDSVLLSRTLHQFGNAILEHTIQLLGIDTTEMYLVSRHEDLYGDTELMLLAATGAAVELHHEWTPSILPAEVKKRILLALEQKTSSSEDGIFIGYYNTDPRTESVLYTHFRHPHSSLQQDILRMFAANITLIFQNLSARETVQETQKELLLIMGEAIEQRSKETGAHVRRVAMMSELLALKVGMSVEFAETLRHASPLHDLGKVGIPEHILHKPGKLDEDEWEIMKTHATIGYDLLKGSSRIIAKMGARVAHSHHEHWDGNGYPQGLAGEAIPLEGRIVAIIDVIDALGSERSYKKPWAEADIRAYVRERRGRQFDPKLVDAALDLFDAFRAVREQLPDKPGTGH